jgi:hypothetical protein
VARGQTNIEAELAAGLNLLHEFALQDPRAELALDRIGAELGAPMPARPATQLPRLNMAWDIQREGRGGRRTTDEYRERAREFGIPLEQGIGWEPARDAVRSWEAAISQVDSEYLNPFMEGHWEPNG